jgi:transcriptional regulator with XRE-family HTH domain
MKSSWPTDIKLNLGEKIKKRRIAAGLSQKEVAQRSQITVSFLSQLEREKAFPSLKSLINISHALGIRVNQLLDEEIRAAKKIIVTKRNTSEGFVLEDGEGLSFRLD